MTGDGIPSHVKLKSAAAALDLSPQTVRRWADLGKVPTLQHSEHSTRYITRETLEVFERSGWHVDWSVLVDAALE